MCCWPYTDVELEDAPPPKKKEEEKKQYQLVSDQLQLHPVTPPAMVYQPPTATYYYAAQPAPEPLKTNYWYGASKAEVDKRNIAAAHATGVTKPVQLVPHGTTADQQFYVKEFDGSWTLRTTTDIMGSCQPGRWEYAQGGYPFFVRQKKD